ncbi:MAG: glycosyl transferase, partial [Deltaproteobacteria bacterium]|nr:glycosyl transferase [Deltaproteobacteria bacterium]
MKRNPIVVVSSDVVGQRMAGPAIRAVELARTLSRSLAGQEVVLAAPNQAPVDGLEVVSFRQGRLKSLISSARVVIGQGLGLPLAPLLSPGHALVLDFYDPNPVEVMAFHRHSPRRVARRSQEFLRHRLLALAKRGDFFLCATQRQRDFWLGLLAAAGRLSWEADQSQPNLDDLLAIVPFGLPDEPPWSSRPVVKGVWPGIGVKDKVLLWGGGIWNWFDPLTVIRAVARVAQKKADIRLFFLGVDHPNPRIPAMAMTQRAMDLAQEMGLLNKVVFFNQGWVDYQDRA